MATKRKKKPTKPEPPPQPEAAGFVVAPGMAVLNQGRPGVVVGVLSLTEAMVRDKATGHTSKVAVDTIKPPETTLAKPRIPTDLHGLTEAEWAEANRRFRAIEGLRNGEVNVPILAKQAKDAGVHLATLYRWHRDFKVGEGRISALLPAKPPGGGGKGRLDGRVEDIVQQVLRDLYLKSQRPKVAVVQREIATRCKAADLPAPSFNTIQARVAILDGYEKIKARIGAKEAREASHIHRGPFQGAEYPLSIVQIDHTPLDIILVDETTRMPLGRPWLTLAIDVYSRMVVGYYLTFDPPGALSVGLCLVHGILPKDVWLGKFDIQAQWPCWGIPTTIHADNGKDFRSKTIQRSCQEYRINIEWRPVGRANFGGHIERLLGTFLQEIHQLAGTTFSSVADRGNYDSMGKSALTLREFEVWLANFITGVYHQRPHSGIEGQCPLKRYEEGVLGTPDRPGRGLPPRIRDERRLLLDFLPGVERNIQEYGVQIDNVTYFADELRPHVIVVDPEHPTRKRRFLFKRDPRDISVVYFLDPNTHEYCSIPYRDTSYPPISMWELREAHRRVREHHKGQINEGLIFQAIQTMRGIEAAAVATTTKARRTQARRKAHREAAVHKVVSIQEAGSPEALGASPGPSAPSTPWPEKVQPYAEEPSAFDALFRKPIRPFPVEK